MITDLVGPKIYSICQFPFGRRGRYIVHMTVSLEEQPAMFSI